MKILEKVHSYHKIIAVAIIDFIVEVIGREMDIEDTVNCYLGDPDGITDKIYYWDLWWEDSKTVDEFIYKYIPEPLREVYREKIYMKDFFHNDYLKKLLEKIPPENIITPIDEQESSEQAEETHISLQDDDYFKSLVANINQYPTDENNTSEDITKQLKYLFPNSGYIISAEEVVYKREFTKVLDRIKIAARGEDEDYLAEWNLVYLAKFMQLISTGQTENAYDLIYPIINATITANNVNLTEIYQLAAKFDATKQTEIRSLGADLLTTDVIKYLRIIKCMKNTKNRATLISLFNYAFNDEIKKDATELLDLINNGVDINSIEDGKPIVFKYKLTDYLLTILKEYKYNFDLTDDKGYNLAMRTIEDSYYKYFKEPIPNSVILSLLEANFDINHKNDSGLTLFELFIPSRYTDDPEIVKRLEFLYHTSLTTPDEQFEKATKEIKEFVIKYRCSGN